MSRVVNNKRGFLQLLADCPAYQRQVFLKTASPQQLHALVEVLYYGDLPASANEANSFISLRNVPIQIFAIFFCFIILEV